MTYRKNTLKIFKKNRLWKKIRHIVVLQEFDTVFKFENNYGFSKLTYNGFGKYTHITIHSVSKVYLSCRYSLGWSQNCTVRTRRCTMSGMQCRQNAIILMLLSVTS